MTKTFFDQNGKAVELEQQKDGYYIAYSAEPEGIWDFEPGFFATYKEAYDYIVNAFKEEGCKKSFWREYKPSIYERRINEKAGDDIMKTIFENPSEMTETSWVWLPILVQEVWDDCGVSQEGTRRWSAKEIKEQYEDDCRNEKANHPNYILDVNEKKIYPLTDGKGKFIVWALCSDGLDDTWELFYTQAGLSERLHELVCYAKEELPEEEKHLWSERLKGDWNTCVCEYHLSGEATDEALEGWGWSLTNLQENQRRKFDFLQDDAEHGRDGAWVKAYDLEEIYGEWFETYQR